MPLKKSKNIARLCLLCWFIWYSLTATATIAYISGMFGSIRPIDDFINKCSEDYYYSSLVISDDSYSFDDVTGCRENENNATCVYSVKDSRVNNFYNQTHNLDKETRLFLRSQPKNEVVIADIEELEKYPATNLLLNSTLKSIEKVWFKPYWKSNKIKKVFIITTSKPKDYCDKSAFIILKNI